MNTLTNNDINNLPSEPKRLGPPRPIVGAFIGILVFLSITLPFEFMPVYVYANVPRILTTSIFGFQFLGILAAALFNGLAISAGFSISPLAGIIIILVVSSIPPAFLGWMIASYKNSTKVVGITLLLIYVIISAMLGFFMAQFAI